MVKIVHSECDELMLIGDFFFERRILPVMGTHP
jgi:hypothetical protein